MPDENYGEIDKAVKYRGDVVVHIFLLLKLFQNKLCLFNYNVTI